MPEDPRSGQPPAVMLVMGVATAFPVKLVPPPFGAVLQGVSTTCMMLAVPATLASIVVASRVAQGRPVSSRLDRAFLRQVLGDLRASLQEMDRLTKLPYVPVAAPFGETPTARAARLDQLHAFSAMMRASQVNLRPLYAFWGYLLAALPLLFSCFVGLGIIGIIHDIARKQISGDTGNAIFVSVLCTAMAAASVLFARSRRELGRRVARLAANLGVAVVVNHPTAMLDWLRSNWADTPPTFGLSAWGWHWMASFQVRGRPALLSVLDDLGTRQTPRIRRIDLFLPRASEQPILGADAVARVRALGFEPVESPAGVRMERRDNDPAALELIAFEELIRAVDVA